MKSTTSIRLLTLTLILGTCGSLKADVEPNPGTSLSDRFKRSADRYIGRPYVWGASGLKSFDCSGFVWRVMFDNGILFKRTTARKLYMCFPKVSSAGAERKSGNIVFFNNLKHCGIVNDGESFYHAETTKGTNLSRFDPYWRSKVSGYRLLPVEGN